MQKELACRCRLGESVQSGLLEADGWAEPGRLQEGRGLGKLLILTWSYSVKNLSKYGESTAKPHLLFSGRSATFLSVLSGRRNSMHIQISAVLPTECYSILFTP